MSGCLHQWLICRFGFGSWPFENKKMPHSALSLAEWGIPAPFTCICTYIYIYNYMVIWLLPHHGVKLFFHVILYIYYIHMYIVYPQWLHTFTPMTGHKPTPLAGSLISRQDQERPAAYRRGANPPPLCMQQLKYRFTKLRHPKKYNLETMWWNKAEYVSHWHFQQFPSCGGNGYVFLCQIWVQRWRLV